MYIYIYVCIYVYIYNVVFANAINHPSVITISGA